MDERVFAGAFGRDEAIALLGVEEFYGADRHIMSQYSNRDRTRAPHGGGCREAGVLKRGAGAPQSVARNVSETYIAHVGLIYNVGG